ncbi:hypothetical protein WJX82_000603 [Trebouxia sp. C0006]
MSLPSFKHAAASLLQVVAALHEKEHFIGAFMPDRLLLDSDDTLYLLDFTTGQVQGQESEAAEWQDEEEVRFPPHSNQDLLLIFWQP